MEAQWDPFFFMFPRCCYFCKYRHFLTRCEGAGTNNSLRERRHEHVVRLDEEELPTAAFIFMKVTVLEELHRHPVEPAGSPIRAMRLSVAGKESDARFRLSCCIHHDFCEIHQHVVERRAFQWPPAVEWSIRLRHGRTE